MLGQQTADGLGLARVLRCRGIGVDVDGRRCKVAARQALSDKIPRWRHQRRVEPARDGDRPGAHLLRLEQLHRLGDALCRSRDDGLPWRVEIRYPDAIHGL